MNTYNQNTSRSRAYTLLDVLTAVALIGVISGFALIKTSGARSASETRKLKQDIASLNSAIRIFKANGGVIAPSWGPNKVLEELKTEATALSARRLNGLRGSMLDPRVVALMEDADEAASGTPKGLWDADAQRFYVSTDNVIGIREFRLDDELSEGETEQRERETNLQLAQTDGWIWDYTDTGSVISSGLNAPDSVDATPSGEGQDGTGSDALALNKPLFSIASGKFALKDYDLQLELSNAPNPQESSIVVYSTDGNNWSEYSEPISIAPKTNVMAYSASTDAENWSDSDIAIERYDFDRVRLEASLEFEKPAYNYVEMGGDLMPGNYTREDAAPGLLTINNTDDLPEELANEESFSFSWTYDGSSPYDSSSAVAGDGGLASIWEDDVPISLTAFDGSAAMIVKAAAISEVSEFVDDSYLVTETLAIEQIQLRAPVVQLLGPSSAPAQLIGFEFVTDYGDMPDGAEIYYTTDGTTPTRDSVPYAAPFSGAWIVELKAAVFPPAEYDEWFIPSEPTVFAPDPADWTISGIASGEFSNPEGDSNLNTNLLAGMSSNYFQWGTPHNSWDVANYSEFDGFSFADVSIGDSFLLGEFEYRNGTTTLGTNATDVDFAIEIAFGGGGEFMSFDFELDLFSTPNNTGTQEGDADFLHLPDMAASAPVSFFGNDYMLELAFGETTDQGFSQIDSFHIFENAVATGELWGSIVLF